VKEAVPRARRAIVSTGRPTGPAFDAALQATDAERWVSWIGRPLTTGTGLAERWISWAGPSAETAGTGSVSLDSCGSVHTG
jgi:hypothetical protein